jgi:hypothetical protein
MILTSAIGRGGRSAVLTRSELIRHSQRINPETPGPIRDLHAIGKGKRRKDIVNPVMSLLSRIKADFKKIAL